MNMQKITAKQIDFAYISGKPVLQEVSFQIGAGESIGLIGANGVGKSTLLKLLVGLHTEYTGELTIDGIPVEKKNLAQIRSKIGYVFQDADNQLFMTTVYQDVAFGPENKGLGKAEVERVVEEALAATGIAHLREEPIHRLSGGEKKLVSIATILSMEPDIILMDEPSVALDPKNRRNLIHILNRLDHTKIISSHDLDFIWDTTTRTILLANGRIAADGPTEEILRNKELLEQCGLELPLSMTRR